MTRFRYAHVVVPLAVLAPSSAYAHLVNSGMGPFYDGVMHLALSPDDWLGLLAAALLAGLCGARAGRWTLAVLPAAWLFGAIVGLGWPVFPESQTVSILSFIVVGLLVALDTKLPVWGVATIAGVFGLMHGLQNGVALHSADGSLIDVLGIATTVFVLSLLVSAAVVSLRPSWTRAAVRVAGSWIVAVGMLMIGWLFRAAT